MLKVVVFSVIILLICVVLFCIKIIIKKNGRFPNTHAGGNPALGKKGIKCAQAQDFEARLQMNLFERLQKDN
ncbi:MAG: hypothetical protein LBL07_09060 [Tannerella sp.]|jgi:hypothetical protein|nr:hypothetical protein [Tannerella sp.]